MQFDIPRDRILRIDVARIAFVDGPHPYETANAVAIEAFWQQQRTANPRYFDGTVVLFSKVVWRDGRLDAVCHPIRFATYLHWRAGRPASAEHLYAHAIPVCSDGALVAIRMSAGTANAGRVYFAAGSFEPGDAAGGLIDIDANMEREVNEETGLSLAGLPRDPCWHGWSSGRGTVIVRRYRLSEDSATVAARIRDFVAADPDPEIDGPVIIRQGEMPEGLMPHMPPLVHWHFGTMARPG